MSLDIFRLKDDSQEDSDSLPDPDVLAGDIAKPPSPNSAASTQRWERNNGTVRHSGV